MRLPAFDYQAPASLSELTALKAELGSAAAVLAGGSDLLVRLERRLAAPEVLLSIKNIREIKEIKAEGVNLIIGAGASLHEVINDQTAREEFPGLVEALGAVGHQTCQHHTATIGGNLLLEPRCLHYNQSAFWRSGRERCFKAGGQVCLALPDSQECSSACLSDGAPMLVALSAQVKVASTRGERVLAASDLFTHKGETPFSLRPEEVLTEIRLPRPVNGFGSAYEKLSYRSHLDFPLISAAAAVGLSRGKIDRVRLVIGGAGPAPLVVDEADQLLRGEAPVPELIGRAGTAAATLAAGRIVDNAGATMEYRRRMVGVVAARALERAAGRAG